MAMEWKGIFAAEVEEDEDEVAVVEEEDEAAVAAGSPAT